MKCLLLFLLVSLTLAQKLHYNTILPHNLDVIELEDSVLMVIPLKKGSYSIKYSLQHLVVIFNDDIYLKYNIPQFIRVEDMQSITLDDKEVCIVLPIRKVDEFGKPQIIEPVEQVKQLIDIRQGRMVKPKFNLMANAF